MLRSYIRLAVFICGFLVAVEISARIDDRIAFSAPLIAPYNSDNLTTYDMEGIPINVPNVRFEKWRHNKYGFRGPDIGEYPPQGTRRIICLGASESYGLHESPGKEWPAQLQELLPFPAYQVVNASRAGLGFNTFERYFEKYVEPLHPDTVVFVINPFFYFDNLEKSLSAKKVSTSPAAPPTSRSIVKTIIGNSRSLPKIKATVKAAAMASFPSVLERYQTWNLQRQLKNLEAVNMKGAQSRERVPDEYLHRLHADLTRLIFSVKRHKIDVILCTYPSLASYETIVRYPVLLLDLRRFFAQYSLMGLVAANDAFNGTAATVASEMNIRLVDAAGTIPKTTEFFGDGVHYTDRGAYLLAKAVAMQVNPAQAGDVKIPVHGNVQ